MALESVENPEISLAIIGDFTLENNLTNFTDNTTHLNEFKIITDFDVVQYNQEVLKVQDSKAFEQNKNEEH